jgi:hypothetical protein
VVVFVMGETCVIPLSSGGYYRSKAQHCLDSTLYDNESIHNFRTIFKFEQYSLQGRIKI